MPDKRPSFLSRAGEFLSDPIAMKGVLGGAQLLGGLGARIFNKRPEYEIPESLRRAVAIAEAQALDPYMPGYDEAEANIQLALANAIQASQQSGDAQIGFQGQVAEATSASRNLAAQNAQSQHQDQQVYSQMLQELATAEDMQFQMNEFAPFSDTQQESTDIIGAGLENIYGNLIDRSYIPAPVRSKKAAGITGEAAVESGTNALSEIGASVSDYDNFLKNYITQNASSLLSTF